MEHDFDRDMDRHDDDDRYDRDRDRRATEDERTGGSNVILIGAMGSGKSSVGWQLARAIGYGFIDLDAAIEAREKKAISQIFAERGETAFRQLETEELMRLRGMRSHVLSVGGGAVMAEENWQLIEELGTTVWLATPAAEIARRFNTDDAELKKRPLLSELEGLKDKEQRQKLLTERLGAIIGQRMDRYKKATLAVTDSFSTPISTAHLIRDLLVKDGFVRMTPDCRPFDRWRNL